MTRVSTASIALWVAVTASACHTPTSRDPTPYRPQGEESRDPLQALKLSKDAAELIGNDPATAERMLRDALSLDLYCGHAHNNLGVVFLSEGKLYEAASEFEWARRLMPGNPEPRVNLGMTLERAQRVDEAIVAYRSALEVVTEDIGAMQALARAQVYHGREDEQTPRLLREISLRGEDEAWRSWAQALASAER